MEAEFIQSIMAKIDKIDSTMVKVKEDLTILKAEWRASAENRKLHTEFTREFGTAEKLGQYMAKLDTKVYKLEHDRTVASTISKTRSTLFGAAAGGSIAIIIAVVQILLQSGTP